MADLIEYKIAFHIGNNYMAFLQFEFLCGILGKLFMV